MGRRYPFRKDLVICSHCKLTCYSNDNQAQQIRCEDTIQKPQFSLLSPGCHQFGGTRLLSRFCAFVFFHVSTDISELVRNVHLFWLFHQSSFWKCQALFVHVIEVVNIRVRNSEAEGLQTSAVSEFRALNSISIYISLVSLIFLPSAWLQYLHCSKDSPLPLSLPLLLFLSLSSLPFTFAEINWIL